LAEVKAFFANVATTFAAEDFCTFLAALAALGFAMKELTSL
jgi:hypothetical protein